MYRVFVFFSVYLCLSVSYAEPEVDLRLGQEINELCAGCHGEFGEGGKNGEYPRLAGLPVNYIIEQIKLFKDEKRKNMPMRPYANERELPEEDVPSVAAYLSQIKLTSTMPAFDEKVTAYEKLLIAKKVFNIAKVEGDIEMGQEVYVDDCQLCHGEQGKGKEDSDTPPLTGQYTEYMIKQIQLFANGERWHEYGEELFSDMEPETIQAIMAYLSIMDDE
jgi:cytochrome c553